MSKVLEKGKVNAKFVLKICYFLFIAGQLFFHKKLVKILFLHFKQLYYAYVEYVWSNYILCLIICELFKFDREDTIKII